jgi:hypothetical protein
MYQGYAIPVSAEAHCTSQGSGQFGGGPPKRLAAEKLDTLLIHTSLRHFPTTTFRSTDGD